MHITNIEEFYEEVRKIAGTASHCVAMDKFDTGPIHYRAWVNLHNVANGWTDNYTDPEKALTELAGKIYRALLDGKITTDS